FQRLTFSVVVFLGALGAVALLGTLSLAVILAQVVALVLLGFAPVALVIGIFPSAGHDLFRAWLGKLATAVFIKALYSLVIALVGLSRAGSSSDGAQQESALSGGQDARPGGGEDTRPSAAASGATGVTEPVQDKSNGSAHAPGSARSGEPDRLTPGDPLYA